MEEEIKDSLTKKKVGFGAAVFLVFLSGFVAAKFVTVHGITDYFRFGFCIFLGINLAMLSWYNATK